MDSFKWIVGAGVAAVALAACGGNDLEARANDIGPAQCAPGQVCTTPPVMNTAGGTGLPPVNSAGTQAPPVIDNNQTVTPATYEGMPCEVATTTQNACGACHGATPSGGAPMRLVTQADWHAAATLDPQKRPVYVVAAERINLGNMNGRMPPPPNALLDQAQLGILNAWLNAGAVRSEADCGGVVQQPPVTQQPPTNNNPPTTDPNLMCFKFLAHAPGSMDMPFQVGAARDEYYNFTFKAPWTGMAWGREYKSIIDPVEGSPVHHWLMYKNASGAGTDGAVEPSIGAHPGGELVHGWAPGGDDLMLTGRDEEVGIEMPSTATYTLELHYNSNNANAVDHSGIEICVTQTEPDNVAWLSWLGTDAINGTSATGTCNPKDERIRLLGWTPHMHTKGIHMKSVINRANGMKETIHDEPFDFNYQVAYEGDFWIEPGDTITTTCTYNSPASFGEGTGDEMCYMFTLSYPKGAMADNGLLGSTIHGPNACLGF